MITETFNTHQSARSHCFLQYPLIPFYFSTEWYLETFFHKTDILAVLGRMQERIRSFRSPPTPIQTPVILFPKCVCTFKEAVYILVFERGKQNRGDLWICWRRKKLLLSKLMDSENSLCICLTKPRFIQSHQRVIWTSLNLISWRMHFSRRYNSRRSCTGFWELEHLNFTWSSLYFFFKMQQYMTTKVK